MHVSRATENLDPDDKKYSCKNRVKKISRRHKTIKEIIINMAEMEINKNVDEIMTKANTLIEALPYIRRFNGATIIVKYGGSAMLDDKLKMNVIKDVALLKLVGMRPIIVHGGGKEISKWVKLSGKEPEFYNGLRVTDKETMNIAEMVLNKVNKELVGLMQKMGVNAVGLCGKDGNMIRVNKRCQMEKILDL